MPYMSELIIQVCMGLGTLSTSMTPSCPEQMHVCMRDTFQINFWDELDQSKKDVLPLQLAYCRAEILLEQE